MATPTLATVPNELLASIFEYFLDDHETLENLSKAHPRFASPANAVRHCIGTIHVRNPPYGAQKECKLLVKSLARAQNESEVNNSSSSAFNVPIRYLEVEFYNGPECRLAGAIQQVLDSLPAVRHVTLKISGRPFPDTPYVDVVVNLEEKVRRAVQDYSTLMDMLNALKPRRKIGLSLALDNCMLRCSPVIAQHYANIVLRDFHIKYYFVYSDTISALCERLDYARATLTDVTILEDARNTWRVAQEPHISFSGLTALKRLRIPASVWFEEASCGGPGDIGISGFLWMHGHDVRPSVVHLLPPSLSSLRVDFMGNASLFAVGMGYRAACSRMTSDEAKMEMRPAWNWIHELTAASDAADVADALQFPHLDNVEVLESMAYGERRGVDDNSVVDWDPPLELKKAFEDRRVKLKIRIRVKVS